MAPIAKVVFDSPQIIVKGQMGGRFRTPGEPIICIDSQDVVHITFQAGSSASFYDQVFYTNNFTGSFASPVRVTQGLYVVENYVMVVDDRGWPHFAIIALEHTSLDHMQTFYVQTTGDPYSAPTFSPAVNVSNWPRSTQDFWPAIAVDTERHAHIGFSDPYGLITHGEGGIWYTNNTGGSFSTPVKMQFVGGFAPWLQADMDGVIHGVWKSPSYYMEYNNNVSGNFDVYDDTRVAYIGGGGFFGPRYFTIGPTGHLHATYSEYPSYDIYYVHGTVGVCYDLIPPDGVGIEDIQVVAGHWGLQAGDPDWDGNFDLDGDLEITMADIILVAERWNQSCP